MSDYNKYLDVEPTLETLDNFIVRAAILDAVKRILCLCSGTLIDVGCGNMPYKSLFLTPPSRVKQYIGLDVKGNRYQMPDVYWDGKSMPIENNSVDNIIATEVLEHVQTPDVFMAEVFRILKPNGLFFFTVPFLWPLHDVPYDEYRYTPFALERILQKAGFAQIKMKALGGWDASLAQMIGLWVRRRPMSLRKRKWLSKLALPVVKYLIRYDCPPLTFGESTMLVGITGTVLKTAG